MDRDDTQNLHESTTQRLQLIDNGFAPIPLKGKACYLDDWPRVETTAEWVRTFDRWGAWRNTGIRVGHPDEAGKLVPIDIDCTDEDIAADVRDIAFEFLGPTTWERIGRAPKTLLLYWCDDQRKHWSAKWEGDADEPQGVEVLGRAKQFAAIGIHPDTEQPYRWLEANPLEQTIDDVPAVTIEQIDSFIDEVQKYFENELRFTRRQTAADAGEFDSHHVLTDDMTFTTRDEGPMSVVELVDRLRDTDEALVCHLDGIRPTSDSFGGLARWTHDGLVIADFVECSNYYEATPYDALAAELQELLPGPDRNTARGILETLTANYVLVGDGTARTIQDPTRAYKVGNLANLYGQKLPEKGNPLAFNRWKSQASTMRAEYALMFPASTDRFIEDTDGQRVLNTYVAPNHPIGGEVHTFHVFMNHLVPDERERNLVLDWIANKVQHPADRAHALVMVAPNVFGTGRNTLAAILERLIKPEYFRRVTLGHLLGRGHQAKYNDWMVDSLVAFIPEAQDTDDEMDFNARRKAYESIKQVVETKAERTMVIRKTVANQAEVVYTSLFIATNHADAFAIEPNDRRMMIVSNGEPLPADLAKHIHAWLEVPNNIGQLYAELADRAIEYEPHGMPPVTKAKSAMIEHSKGGLDEAYERMLEDMPGDVVTIVQAERYFRWARDHYEIENFPGDVNVQKLKQWVGRQLGAKASKLPQLRIGDARPRPWAIRHRDRWESTADNDAIRAEVAKNGPSDDNVVGIKAPWE